MATAQDTTVRPKEKTRKKVKDAPKPENVQQLSQCEPMATAQGGALQPKTNTEEEVEDTSEPENVGTSSLQPKKEKTQVCKYCGWHKPTTPRGLKHHLAQCSVKKDQDKIRTDCLAKIKMLEQKMSDVRALSYDCEVSFYWSGINSVFLEMAKVVNNFWQETFQFLEERRKTLKTEAAVVIKKLENDTDELKNIIDQLDQHPKAQVSLPEGLDDSLDWQSCVTATTAVSLGTLRSLTSNMIKKLHQTLDQLSPVELKRISSFAVDVKLDPATAHQGLFPSDDGKTVSVTEEDHNVPDTPERFDTLGSVLGLNRFSVGKAYWEVEVRNKTGWELGAARHNVKRKGNVPLNPDYGYWVVTHSHENYIALSSPAIFLSLSVKPQKVGVFVDYDEGLVSFYDVTSQSHIYSFTGCLFHGEIVPYFGPHPPQDGENSDPLIITAVEKQK